MKDDNVYQWYIMKCPPRPGPPNEFIGPFDSIDERDEECIRLQKEEDETTSFIPNKRMSLAAHSFWRYDVLDYAATVNNRLKKAA